MLAALTAIVLAGAPSIGAGAEVFTARIAKDPARWSILLKSANGAAIRTEVLQRPPLRRWVFSIQGKTLAAVVEREGQWYAWQPAFQVQERSGPPWGITLELPTLYVALATSSLLVVTPALARLAKTESIEEGGRVRLAFELTGERRRLAEALLIESASLPKTSWALVKPLERLVEEGQILEAEADTGLVRRAGEALEVDSFEWLDKVDDDEFEVGQAESSIFSPARSDDVVLIGLCGAWRPGHPACEGDPHLLDTRTGATQRVRVPMGGAIGGSLSPDRKAAFVSVQIGGSMQLLEVALDTGKVRSPWAKALSGANVMFPRVSPDGKRIAVTVMGGSSVLESGLWLVDRKTGRVKQASKPMDQAFQSWLPDGSGFILLVRKEEEKRVCRLGLDQEVTELFEGDNPALLGSERILYKDVKTSNWWTRKLNGSDPQQFGDGLAGFFAPAVAPDGKRAVFMKRLGESGDVRPYLVKSHGKTANATAIPTRAGLFSWPAF